MSPRTSILLPGTVGISQAADAARHALCTFLSLDATAPRALGQWLARPYREATRFGANTRSVALASEIAPVIVEAQRTMAQVIEAAAGGAEALVEFLPAIVHVRPAHDRFGGRGFVPFEVPHASLVERTIALALADYLTRPDDFLGHGFAAAASPLRRISSTTWRTSNLPHVPSGHSSAA